jgi:hypothetical protein
VSHFTALYETLPVTTQRIVQGVVQQRTAKRLRGSNIHLPKLLKIKESDIGVPRNLEYKSWAEPETFLNSSGKPYTGCVIAQVCEELRQIEKRAVEDPIRQRIYAVALFALHSQVKKFSKTQSGSYFTPITIDSISKSLIKSGIVSDEEAYSWVELHLRFGQRMNSIAARNGGLEALMVIPALRMTLKQ